MSLPEPDFHRSSSGPTIAGVPIDEIGVLPAAAARINAMVGLPSTTAEDVAELIVHDPALTAAVLRVVNSAYYGLRQNIGSIVHAVGYLGIGQVRNLVVSSSLIETFRFSDAWFDPRAVWEHSLGCAIAAKSLGEALPSIDGDLAYLGGLLHDLGRIVFLARFAGRYRELIDGTERDLAELSRAEHAGFGVTHEQAGFVLGRSWRFPEPVLAMIRFHHDPQSAGDLTLVAAVATYADALCHQQGLRYGFGLDVDDASASVIQDAAWRMLVERLPGVDPPVREVVDEAIVASLGHTKELVAELF